MGKFVVAEIRYWKGKDKGILLAKQNKTYTEIHPIMKVKVKKCLNTAAFKFLDTGKVIITPMRLLHRNKK